MVLLKITASILCYFITINNKIIVFIKNLQMLSHNSLHMVHKETRMECKSSLFLYREKILRLQHENKMLKLQKSSSEDENGQLLQSMLDDANSRKNELESEVR